MAQGSRQYELILFGATGYTGKLTAEWISEHLPQDLKWAIAGRNTQKLQSIVDELKTLNPNRKQPDIETCELKKDQLDTLAKKTKLLITTVGPFMLYGEPVVAACAENGTHYLDCTGEIPWYHDMVANYHETAKKNGAIIIPECGLDSVPADIMAFVLARHIRKTLSAPTERVLVTLWDFKSGVSGGSSATVLQLFEKYPMKKLALIANPWSISPIPPSKPHPRLRGTGLLGLLGLLKIPELGGLQTVGAMSTVDSCIVHRSWGLYESTAKSTSRPEISYGGKFRFNEYMRAKSIIKGAMFRWGFTLFGLFMAIPLTRWILSPLIRKFVVPKPGEGPTKDTMKDDFISYRGLGIADTDKREKVIAKLDCAHGGYAATALTLAAAADVILRSRLEETEAGRLGGGIVTPATLGELYVTKLNEFGMKIEVGA